MWNLYDYDECYGYKGFFGYLWNIFKFESKDEKIFELLLSFDISNKILRDDWDNMFIIWVLEEVFYIKFLMLFVVIKVDE